MRALIATFVRSCRSLARAVRYFFASCPSKNLAKVCKDPLGADQRRNWRRNGWIQNDFCFTCHSGVLCFSVFSNMCFSLQWEAWFCKPTSSTLHSKNHFSDPQLALIRAVFATFVRSCRSLARSVRYFFASCSFTNLAKVCNSCLWTRSGRTRSKKTCAQMLSWSTISQYIPPEIFYGAQAFQKHLQAKPPKKASDKDKVK